MKVLPDYSEGYKVYPEVQELLVMLAQCWDALKPYLLPPVSDADYDCQALLLVELYILIGKQQAHPMASLVAHLERQQREYDQQVRLLP